MTDALAAGDGDAGVPRTAGMLIRAAREREGMHLAVLAAHIKVSPAKLEALEQNRIADLPNPTFARALAQSVCRSLKIDPRPVLALLPQVETPPLESALGRLNAPFQDRPTRTDGPPAWSTRPLFLAGGVLLLLAVVVAVWPADLIDRWRSAAASSAPALAAAASSAGSAVAAALAPSSAASAGESASAAAAVAAPAGAESAEGQRMAAGAAASSPAPGVAAAPLPDAASAPPLATAQVQVSASAVSWVEILDPQGQPVLSRTLRAGESVTVDGRVPLRVQVGNVAGTALSFRGQPVDLAPHTRTNVARLELR